MGKGSRCHEVNQWTTFMFHSWNPWYWNLPLTLPAKTTCSSAMWVSQTGTWFSGGVDNSAQRWNVGVAMIDVSWLLGSCELVPVKVGCSNNLGLGKYPEDLTHFTIILIRWHHLLKTWKQWKHRKTGFIMVESLNLYVILILYNMEKMETQENCISETRKDRQRPQLSCGGPTSGLGAQLLLHCSNLGLRSHGQNLTLGRLPLVRIVFQGHKAMKCSEVFLIHPNHYWTILSWLVRSIHHNNLKVNLDHHPKSIGKYEITSQVCFAFPPVDDHEKTRFRMISFHVVLPKINASICNSSHSFIHYRNAVDTSETKLMICYFHPSIFLCCPPTCKLYQINSGWWFQFFEKY